MLAGRGQLALVDATQATYLHQRWQALQHGSEHQTHVCAPSSRTPPAPDRLLAVGAPRLREPAATRERASAAGGESVELSCSAPEASTTCVSGGGGGGVEKVAGGGPQRGEKVRAVPSKGCCGLCLLRTQPHMQQDEPGCCHQVGTRLLQSCCWDTTSWWAAKGKCAGPHTAVLKAGGAGVRQCLDRACACVIF